MEEGEHDGKQPKRMKAKPDPGVWPHICICIILIAQDL